MAELHFFAAMKSAAPPPALEGLRVYGFRVSGSVENRGLRVSGLKEFTRIGSFLFLTL